MRAQKAATFFLNLLVAFAFGFHDLGQDFAAKTVRRGIQPLQGIDLRAGDSFDHQRVRLAVADCTERLLRLLQASAQLCVLFAQHRFAG